MPISHLPISLSLPSVVTISSPPRSTDCRQSSEAREQPIKLLLLHCSFASILQQFSSQKYLSSSMSMSMFLCRLRQCHWCTVDETLIQSKCKIGPKACKGTFTCDVCADGEGMLIHFKVLQPNSTNKLCELPAKGGGHPKILQTLYVNGP